MANHVSSLKRARQTIVKTAINRSNKSKLRGTLRTMREAILKGDAKVITEQYRLTASILDKSVQKGVLHKNTASRYKSRLNARVKAAVVPASRLTSCKPCQNFSIDGPATGTPTSGLAHRWARTACSGFRYCGEAPSPGLYNVGAFRGPSSGASPPEPYAPPASEPPAHRLRCHRSLGHRRNLSPAHPIHILHPSARTVTRLRVGKTIAPEARSSATSRASFTSCRSRAESSGSRCTSICRPPNHRNRPPIRSQREILPGPLHRRNHRMKHLLPRMRLHHLHILPGQQLPIQLNIPAPSCSPSPS